MISKTLSSSLLSLLAAGALLLSSTAMATNPPVDPPAPGEESPYARGPNPTVAFLEANSGPYSTRTSRVSGLVSGFGGGTIHYPTGTEGTMAAIVVIPGFVSAESSIAAAGFLWLLQPLRDTSGRTAFIGPLRRREEFANLIPARSRLSRPTDTTPATGIRETRSGTRAD